MCGVIGIVSEKQVASDLYWGSLSLQHRGQEGAGMVVYDFKKYNVKKGEGTVNMVFARNALARLRGKSGVAQLRYSTTGKSCSQNLQPIQGAFRGVSFWLAHNGNLTGYAKKRDAMARRGYPFKTKTDTEFIVALISQSKKELFEDAMREALAQIQGTYALVALYKEQIYGARDPAGYMPLVIGRGHGITILASESVACDALEIDTLREVHPGEMIVAGPGLNGWYPLSLDQPKTEERFCIFQYVYFGGPDSIFRGKRVELVREEMGHRLWREHPVPADIVVPIQDSGTSAAIGLAEESGLPFKLMAFVRSRYVGRTFIEPLGAERERRAQFKLNIIPETVRGKRVVVVDDSIVRANVIKKIIKRLRKAGASEIHIRISSPPTEWPCYYGIDTYRVKDELIAQRYKGDIEGIRREIGADTLGYLGMDQLRLAVAGSADAHCCDACFTGDYHIPTAR